MKIAVRSHDLGAANAEEIITKLTEYGLDGIQLVCYKTFENIKYAPGAVSGEFLSGLAGRLNAAGKQIFLTGAYFNPVHSDVNKRELGITVFKDYLTNAKYTGCLTVGSETGSYNDDKWTYHPRNRTPEALQSVAEVFGGLCAHAKASGARVGIEGAAGHIAYNVAALKAIIAKTGADNIDVIFDLFNYLDADNHSGYLNILKEGLDAFAGKILCFHIKDYIIENGAVKQTAIGKGMFDYAKILHLIKIYDADAVLVLEGTTGENIAPAASFIRKTWENT